MIKSMFIGFALLMASSAMAQDLNFQAYRKFLMQGQGPKKMAIQTTCTDAEGKVSRIGEKAYDACLNSAKKNQASQKSTTLHFGNN